VAVEPKDLESILTARRHFAQKTLDQFGQLRETYQDRDDRVMMLDQILTGDWHVVWPDRTVERALPKIPNYPRLARSHRTYLVGQTDPTLSIRPSDMTDKAKANAEQRERIVQGWQDRSLVRLLMPEWAGDLVVTGLCATKVLPDMGEKDKAKRFPMYMWVNPRHLYPSPMFAKGPFLDDAIIAFEDKANSVAKRFNSGDTLDRMLATAAKRGMTEADKVRVIEYHDDKVSMVIAEALYRSDPGKNRAFEVLMYEEHGLEKCPIVVGTTSTHDGVYRSQLDDGLAMLNTGNRLMTLHLDSAVQKVYPTLVVSEGVENESDYGPGAVIHLTDPSARIEYLNTPAAAYDNYQIIRQLDSYLRTAFLLPPSLTGDPNESVTSAAGINATQSMPNAEVVAIQRHAIAPMLQAANEIAIRADEKWADVEKTITGVAKGSPFVEKYQPSKAFAGNYANTVTYGMGAGVDAVTLNVALLQNKGEGLISERTAREKSPYVDDPLVEEQQIASEQMQKAAFSALIAGAAAPPGDPRALTADQIVAIWEDLEKPGGLKAALKNHLTQQQQMLMQPPETGAPALASPGMAGAGEPQQPPPFQGPPLEELLGA
jgi:hypothetical protein